MMFACTKCGAVSDKPQCRRHRRDPNAHWSPNRDRRAQEAFRDAVLERDDHRCTWVDPTTDERCSATEDLRACHIRPLRDFENGDAAAYEVSNGTTRCGIHDQLTDPHARRRPSAGKRAPAKSSRVSGPLRLR